MFLYKISVLVLNHPGQHVLSPQVECNFPSLRFLSCFASRQKWPHHLGSEMTWWHVLSTTHWLQQQQQHVNIPIWGEITGALLQFKELNKPFGWEAKGHQEPKKHLLGPPFVGITICLYCLVQLIYRGDMTYLSSVHPELSLSKSEGFRLICSTGQSLGARVSWWLFKLYMLYTLNAGILWLWRYEVWPENYSSAIEMQNRQYSYQVMSMKPFLSHCNTKRLHPNYTSPYQTDRNLQVKKLKFFKNSFNKYQYLHVF